jgi:DNA-binding transcriptional regulator YiaG
MTEQRKKRLKKLKKPIKTLVEKKKQGVKTLYNKDFDELAYKLTLTGLIDQELADIFGISVATLNNWKNKHESFLSSIKKGKDLADSEVVASLNKRAKGYEVEETSQTFLGEQTDEGTGKVTKLLRITKTKKHIPPDAVACFYWLNNRQKKNWKNKHEVTGADGGPIQLSMTDLLKSEKKENTKVSK